MNSKLFQVKSISNSINHRLVISFALILLMTIFAPLLQNQIITGTIINSLLVLSVFMFGLSGALLLVFLPSVISLFLGFLPIAMTPMVPFIILGNIIFVLFVNSLKNKYWIGCISGVLAKSGFLFISSYLLFTYFAGGMSVKVLSSMMGYIQLLTASLGIVLVYPIIKALKKF
ncbi:hypothetical protein M0R01_01290 [bacterium]|nr:hypothetical protein [bacterium]